MNSGTGCVVLQLVAKCCQGGSGDFVKGGIMTDHVARTARTEALIAQLLEVVHELELMHPGRKFPLDGHLVGSIGEAAAEALFAITLVPASTTGYDAVTDAGRKVEIKATFGTSSVSVRPTSSQHEGAALIVLKLSRQPGVPHEVVYNGPLDLALQVAGPTMSNGQATMRLARLRGRDETVPEELRVPARAQLDQ